MMEAQSTQQSGQRRARRFVDGEFDEFSALDPRRRWRIVVSPASASTSASERTPSRAIARADAARNSSLNTSSDSGPA